MGYEKLGYLLVGAAFLCGVAFFLLAGRLGKDWVRKLGLLLGAAAVAGFLVWGLHVGEVRSQVTAAKWGIVIPGPGETVPHGYAEDPAEMIRQMKQELQKAKETCRAYGWRWEEL